MLEVAVKLSVPPAQIGPLLLAAATGFGLTVAVVVAVETQPAGEVTVTV